MPDLISINTSEWKLTVWSKDISGRLKQHESLLAKRNTINDVKYSVIKYDYNLTVNSIKTDVQGSGFFQTIKNKQAIYSTIPMFFENLVYDFEFEFDVNTEWNDNFTPFIASGLSVIDDSFRFKIHNNIGTLRGSINTRNNIGILSLPLQYFVNGQLKKVSLTFEILPVKMDLQTDLPEMYRTIDRELPLWRFAFSEISSFGYDQSHGNPNFLLLWLRQFEALRQELNKGIKIILNSPHARLFKKHDVLRAERIKGRIGRKLEEKIKQDIISNKYNEKYTVKKKYLNIDTPENRFIKYVLKVIYHKLELIEKQAYLFDHELDNHRLSTNFFKNMKAWKEPLKKFRENSVFKDIGDFTGLTSESLVLQQKSGYSTVYRTWQQLNFYLSYFSGQISVSSKPVNDLYEVWCFLEIKRILVDNFSFKERTTSKALLKNKGLELSLKDGMSHAFEFFRDDGVTIRLAHEPVFRKSGKNFRTCSLTQVPDIFLEATYKDGTSLIWLFDAKYRIEKNKSSSSNSQVDRVPEDAINQMHRYRDSIFYNERGEKNESVLSRPIMGAFALYPGVFDQQNEDINNPYNESILKIGIGAFPLLPNQASDMHNGWLIKFLKSKLEYPQEYRSSNDKILSEPNTSIPVKGMNMHFKT